MRNDLRKAFDGNTPIVKAVDAENTYNITTSYLINDASEDAQSRVEDKLFEGVAGLVGGNLEKASFFDQDADGTHVTSSSRVGPTIADDIKKSAFLAGAISLFVIFLYIFIRFNQAKYSMGGVIALFHDTIITVGMFSVLRGLLPFSMEIDQAFIAAILTVIGYSINDTVIVYDRIRERVAMNPGLNKTTLINNAINSTLSRTLITSLTTLFTVFVLLLFGGASIKGFAFALLVGIGFGTYSSVFVASALVHDFTKSDTMVDNAKVSQTQTGGARGFSSKAVEKL